jgi:hypothetical protein
MPASEEATVAVDGALLVRIPARRYAAVSAFAVGLPTIVAASAHGALSLAAAVIALLAVAGVGATFAVRRSWLGRPLEVAPVVARGRREGVAIYRFRVRLGHGRSVRSARARVEYRPRDGVPVVLDVDDPEGTRIGAWTVVVRDRAGVCDAPGDFVLRIEAIERGKLWTAEQVYPAAAVKDGRFDAGIVKTGSGADWDDAGWARIVETD